jgi:hypothetical protein
MKCIVLFLLFVCGLSLEGNTQVTLRGKVYDSLSNSPIGSVSIENMTSHQGCLSNANGEFSLEANVGDYIVFSHVGFNRKVLRLKIMDDVNRIQVFMTTKSKNLKPVTIKRGLTKYQKDSLNRAEIYGDAFGYEQQKSAFSPVTSLYQKFSKKHKNIRKFQEQIIAIEHQKFIDTRYSPELVMQLTGLDPEGMAHFMNNYPMEYSYARVATDLEIKMWIKFNYQDYVKNKGKRPEALEEETGKKKKKRRS